MSMTQAWAGAAAKQKCWVLDECAGRSISPGMGAQVPARVKVINRDMEDLERSSWEPSSSTGTC